MMSQRDSWELAKIKEGMEFDPVSKTFRVKYLFLDNLRKLPDNKKVILKMVETTEKRLKKYDLTDEAN